MHYCFISLKLITKTLFADFMITVSRVQKIPDIDPPFLDELIYRKIVNIIYVYSQFIRYKSEPILF